MFSGIVEETAEVVLFSEQGAAARLGVLSRLDHAATKLGDSVLIDGICLTVVKITPAALAAPGTVLEFDLASETLRATTFRSLKVKSLVHLERSLVMGERIHGHLVFGHGDGELELLSREPQGECERLVWKMPERLGRFVVPKGSISVAGVSLTIGEVTATTFSVYCVPHTSSVTRLAKIAIGEQVNVEVDQLARYVVKNLEFQMRGEKVV